MLKNETTHDRAASQQMLLRTMEVSSYKSRLWDSPKGCLTIAKHRENSGLDFQRRLQGSYANARPKKCQWAKPAPAKKQVLNVTHM
jgi:hypothetical protein